MNPAAGTAPKVRDAVTVILLRDGPGGAVGVDDSGGIDDAGRSSSLQVFTLRRRMTLRAFGGLTVFPGGSVDRSDFGDVTGERWIGRPPSWWIGPMSTDGDRDFARGLVRAAIRELFEETGVLLVGTGSEHVLAGTGTAVWESARQAVESGRQALPALLAEHGLAMRVDLLRPWAHWLTPETEPYRFDTRFLVAEIPAGQAARQVGGEAAAAGWSSPADLLAEQAAGRLAMVLPTETTVRELARFTSADAVMAAAQSRVVRRVMPTTAGGDQR